MLGLRMGVLAFLRRIWLRRFNDCGVAGPRCWQLSPAQVTSGCILTHLLVHRANTCRPVALSSLNLNFC